MNEWTLFTFFSFLGYLGLYVLYVFTVIISTYIYNRQKHLMHSNVGDIAPVSG